MGISHSDTSINLYFIIGKIIAIIIQDLKYKFHIQKDFINLVEAGHLMKSNQVWIRAVDMI